MLYVQYSNKNIISFFFLHTYLTIVVFYFQSCSKQFSFDLTYFIINFNTRGIVYFDSDQDSLLLVINTYPYYNKKYLVAGSRHRHNFIHAKKGHLWQLCHKLKMF